MLLAANRHFHRLLVNGVQVEYQQDGETRGDFVRLMVKRILRKYKYPPAKAEEAIQLVLEQAENWCAEWA